MKRQRVSFRPDRIASRRLQSGQSMIEFAIALPLLLLLVVGVIEIGRYAYASILVGSAARAGAAYGAQSHLTAGRTGNITTAAQNDFQNNGQPISNLVVTSGWACMCDNAGTMSSLDCATGVCPVGSTRVVDLQVTAQGTFNSLFSFPGIPTPLVITRTATVRIGA